MKAERVKSKNKTMEFFSFQIHESKKQNISSLPMKTSKINHYL